jgi:hypothetical protein
VPLALWFEQHSASRAVVKLLTYAKSAQNVSLEQLQHAFSYF